jgi:hypothetical protein
MIPQDENLAKISLRFLSVGLQDCVKMDLREKDLDLRSDSGSRRGDILLKFIEKLSAFTRLLRCFIYIILILNIYNNRYRRGRLW